MRHDPHEQHFVGERIMFRDPVVRVSDCGIYTGDNMEITFDVRDPIAMGGHAYIGGVAELSRGKAIAMCLKIAEKFGMILLSENQLKKMRARDRRALGLP